MRFALTHGRAGPGPGDVVTSAGSLERLVAGVLGKPVARLWAYVVDEEDGPAHRPLARWREPGRIGREAFVAQVREAALSEARYGYLHGDCWQMAAVAGAALGRPVAVMMAPGHADAGCPDHLAVDLGDGLYLDVRGVLDERSLAAGLQPGSRVVSLMDAADVPALYDALFSGNEEVPSWEETFAGNGFDAETKALFEAFLEAGARAALERPDAGRGLTLP